MANKFDDMRDAMAEARATFHAANEYAAQMAGMLKGRLQHCWSSDLTALKKELRNWDMHRQCWKEKK